MWFQSLMVNRKKLFLNQEVTVLKLLYILHQLKQWEESVAGIVRVLDDISFFFVAALPAESFSSGEINTSDRLGNAHSFPWSLKPWPFQLLNQAMM